jgi:hypothetical protein
LRTEDRNFEARRFNIHRVLGGCCERIVVPTRRTAEPATLRYEWRVIPEPRSLAYTVI